MENERKEIDRVGTLSSHIDRDGTLASIEELTEWLETHEIDDPEYDRKFTELQMLEVDYEPED